MLYPEPVIALRLKEQLQYRASLLTQMVKNLPGMQETWVQSQEDPLEKGMATHSSILAWRIPWTEEPGGLQSTGYKEWNRTEQLTLSLHFTSQYKSEGQIQRRERWRRWCLFGMVF